jgi:cell division protein FtsW (lipid II flippase)
MRSREHQAGVTVEWLFGFLTFLAIAVGLQLVFIEVFGMPVGGASSWLSAGAGLAAGAIVTKLSGED